MAAPAGQAPQWGEPCGAASLALTPRPRPRGQSPALGFCQTFSGWGSEQTPGLPSQPHHNSNNNGFRFVSMGELTQHGAFLLTLSSVSLTTAGLQEALGGHMAGRWGARCEPRTLASPLQALPLLRAPRGPFPYEAFLLPPWTPALA